jgi:hypothetical protein
MLAASETANSAAEVDPMARRGSSRPAVISTGVVSGPQPPPQRHRQPGATGGEEGRRSQPVGHPQRAVHQLGEGTDESQGEESLHGRSL